MAFAVRNVTTKALEAPSQASSAARSRRCLRRSAPGIQVRGMQTQSIALRSTATNQSFRLSKLRGATRPSAPSMRGVVKASAAETSTDLIKEVDSDTFKAEVEEHTSLVVVDCYTTWCGPCKAMYPQLEELATKYSDVKFVKLNCNEQNKTLAKGLGVRSVPTFFLFQGSEKVGQVNGAKVEALEAAINEH